MISPKPVENIAVVLQQLLEDRRGQPVSERDRQLFLTIRRANIMMIGAIEDYLGMERSIPPKDKR